jgi:hypothetical protein
MIRLTAGATFALFVATSVQAMTPAPIPRPDGMLTQVAFGCGPGQTLVNGACVARTAIRQTRRAVRRSYYGTAGYYGGYGTGGYSGGYDGGYYTNRSYVTGRPTLIPRRYGGYGTGGYPGGYDDGRR